MSPKRVVITGGAGFLGSHLCEHYLGAGWNVVCVDNEITGKKDNVAHLASHEGFRWWRHDINEGLYVEGELDLVLHMASLASPPFYKRLPIETLLVGSVGTRNCLELARRTGARVIFASTSEVYGDPAVSPQPESYWGHVNPIGPRSMYDESKRFGEAMVTAYRGAQGVDTGIVRIFNTYGPRMRWDDGRVVTAFLGQLLRGESLTVHGDGQQTRSFCFVEDLVRGVVAMAASHHSGPINLGNPHGEMTIIDLAARLSGLFGRPFTLAPPQPRQDENDPMQRCPDITLAREELGWEPAISFEDGMRRTWTWLEGQLSSR